jgi:hypothetical protein
MIGFADVSVKRLSQFAVIVGRAVRTEACRKRSRRADLWRTTGEGASCRENLGTGG